MKNKPLRNLLIWTAIFVVLVLILWSLFSVEKWISKTTPIIIDIYSKTWEKIEWFYYELSWYVSWARYLYIDSYHYNGNFVNWWHFSSTIYIESTKKILNLHAENKYNTKDVSIILERNPTEEEIIWANSKAWKICEKHPNWNKIECQWIADKKIWIWMSYDMLIEMIWKPNSANPSNYGNWIEWQWCRYKHTPSCFYDQNNDWIIDSYN